jgi:hypothetical protein
MSVTKRRIATDVPPPPAGQRAVTRPPAPESVYAVTITRAQVGRRAGRALVFIAVVVGCIGASKGAAALAKPHFVEVFALTAMWSWWRSPVRATLADQAVEIVVRSKSTVIDLGDITTVYMMISPMGRRWVLATGSLYGCGLYDSAEVRAFLGHLIEQPSFTGRYDTKRLSNRSVRSKR